MSRADSVVNRLNVALNRVGPADRKAYKRVITRTGGDELIGRAGTVTYTDTLLNPQPVFQRLSRFDVGPTAREATVVDPSGNRKVGSEYGFTFSPAAISAAELANADLQIVYKDASGNEEVYFITDVDPVQMNGEDVVYNVYAASVKRP